MYDNAERATAEQHLAITAVQRLDCPVSLSGQDRFSEGQEEVNKDPTHEHMPIERNRHATTAESA
jgi:hypothetical protein